MSSPGFEGGVLKSLTLSSSEMVGLFIWREQSSSLEVAFQHIQLKITFLICSCKKCATESIYMCLKVITKVTLVEEGKCSRFITFIFYNSCRYVSNVCVSMIYNVPSCIFVTCEF